MNLADLNGNLAVFGGLTGVLVIAYMVWMGYWTRQKDLHVQQLQVTLARVEGMLIGWRKE